MKKLLLITLVLLIAGSLQLFPANPIPSYDLKMTFRANFQENNFGQTGKEKRQMNIETSTSSHTPTNKPIHGDDAIVYLYKVHGNKVLGPYEVAYGEVLTVPIDNSEWGVVIELTDPGTTALASVWTGSNNNSMTTLQPDSWFPQSQQDPSYYTLLAQR